MNDSKIKVAVAYHKPWPNVKDGFYLPIHVGALNSSIDLGIQRDSEGDNISHLNPYYCEITALYYLWKNVDAEYKGLCHYRRFLCYKKESMTSKIIHNLTLLTVRVLRLLSVKAHYTYQHYIFLPKESLVQNISEEEELFTELLNDHDIIVPRATVFSNSVREHFQDIIGEKPILILDQILDKSPYKGAYLEMMNGHTCNGGNMSIMKGDVFSEYCEYLFPLLEKHMELVMSPKEMEQGKYLRVSGYIAEILTSLFVKWKQSVARVYETQVYYVDDSSRLNLWGKLLSKSGFFHPYILKG